MSIYTALKGYRELREKDHVQIPLDADVIFIDSDGEPWRTHASNLPNPVSGWASYIDTQYPDSDNAFTIDADTDTILPNNAGTRIESQIPADIAEFYTVPSNYYGTNAFITGRNGDGLDCMFFFKAVPSAQNQWLDVWVDIGGAIGEIYRQTFQFPKGQGVERGVLYALPSAYTLGTWEANGGRIYCRSNDDCDIYRINFNFDRSHRAR